ncbi:hypothetical protein WJX81_002679 [Elliptochloris bilobata]|uniref:Uncharacterized protein n=1 Tax=Elliptochloris bilobata TaxID=381761 RepID=A0AAW1QVV7_9CHLO
MSACCGIQDEVAAELDELATDPALQDCCRRDLQEQAYVARVKAELLAHDRTDERRLAADEAVRRDFAGRTDDGADSLASGSEEEAPELERLRELRLRDLKEQARRKAQLQSAGYGSLSTVHDTELLEEVRKSEAQTTVCHLAVAGTQVGQQMDEHLAGLAHVHIGTRFLRAPLSRRSALLRLLGLQHASALVCFREGAVTARAPAHAFSDGMDLREEDISAWLRRAGVLTGTEHVAAAGSGQGGGDDESEGEVGEEGDWQEPCIECGRRYYHEHGRFSRVGVTKR